MVAQATRTVASPPTSVEVYDFSYSRSTGKMRFRLNGQEWLLKRFAGRWEILSAEKNGNLKVRCKLRVDGDTGAVWLPKDVDPDAYCFPKEMATADTHWRLCYNRQGSENDTRPHWRLRDERTNILHSNDITDYRGVMNVNYFDGGPHIFHDGPVFMDRDGVAHFSL